jgi:hypothetical protein
MPPDFFDTIEGFVAIKKNLREFARMTFKNFELVTRSTRRNVAAWDRML